MRYILLLVPSLNKCVYIFFLWYGFQADQLKAQGFTASFPSNNVKYEVHRYGDLFPHFSVSFRTTYIYTNTVLFMKRASTSFEGFSLCSCSFQFWPGWHGIKEVGRKKIFRLILLFWYCAGVSGLYIHYISY